MSNECTFNYNAYNMAFSYRRQLLHPIVTVIVIIIQEILTATLLDPREVRGTHTPWELAPPQEYSGSATELCISRYGANRIYCLSQHAILV